MSIRVGPYILNLDALLARIVFVWRGHVLFIIAFAAALLLMPRVIDFIRMLMLPDGQVYVIAEQPDALLVDGRPWTGSVKVGTHRFEARWNDAVAWRDVDVQATHAQTVTLSPFLSTMQVRNLPLAPESSIVLAVAYPDGHVSLMIREGQTTPITRTYHVTNGRMERLVSSDVYNGWYERSPDGRTTVSAEGPPERLRVTLQADVQGETLSATYDAKNLLAVSVDIIRQAALVFESSSPRRTNVVWMTNRGRIIQVGAIPGRPTLIRWSPDYRFAVMITKSEDAPDQASLIILDVAEPPSLILGSDALQLSADVLAPPFHVRPDGVVWGEYDQRMRSMNIFQLDMEQRSVTQTSSVPCPAAALSFYDDHHMWICTTQEGWEFYRQDPATSDILGVGRASRMSRSVVAADAFNVDRKMLLMMEPQRLHLVTWEAQDRSRP